MPTVSASASIGVKLKKFSEYENISVHSSMSIERDASEGLSDEQLAEDAQQLYLKLRSKVEHEINKDIESAKGKPPTKK